MANTGFTRPTLTELAERTRSDINSGLPGADARLRRSFLGVLARALAGLAHGLYGYLEWIALQSVPDTATGSGLNSWGRVWGVSRKLATKSAGTVTLTGVNDSVIPSGTEIIRSDGVEFVTTAEATIATGTAAVAVTAAVPGVAGNTSAAVQMTLVSPVSGVNAAGVVAAGGLTGGADVESDAEYRERIVERIQRPPQGGSMNDYRRWAREVAGVTRAWVVGGEMGAGTVTIRFMMDNTYPTGIPESADVTAVQAYIDEPSRRPVTAEVFVAAPVAVGLDITITGLTPNTAAVKVSVESELRDMIRRVAEPGGTIPVSKIWEAISIAAGEEKHVVTIPSADVTHDTGEIATLGTVTYA